VYTPANSTHFSPGAIAQARLVLLGPPGVLYHRIIDSVRSLKDSDLITVDGNADGAGRFNGRPVLAGVRHQFWSRKAQRGFVLAGFPANLAQALVLETWLDERDEALTAAVWLDQTREQALAEAHSQGRDTVDEIETWFRVRSAPANAVAGHFRAGGLLVTVDASAGVDAGVAAFSELFDGQVASR
jgi:hypothetical protein